MASTPVLLSKRKVISGHGEFNESNLEVDGRKKLPTFKLPVGVTLTFYTPDGAGLDESLAHYIELGKDINSKNVEMKHNDSPKILPVETPYPRVFSGEKEVINYTVKKPTGLTVNGGAYIVDASCSLKTVVESLAKQGFTDLHYACCSKGYAGSPTFAKLFPEPGKYYYVRIK